MIKVLLTGCCGKMGNVINNIISERDDCKIIAGIDKDYNKNYNFTIYNSFDDIKVDFDVIIDFSHPSVVDNLIEYINKNRKPAVICTTGLSQKQINRIYDISKITPIFYSANMSLGINVIIDLAKKATQILGNDFDIEIIEKHHNKKIDSPSGTALMIADEISDETPYNANYIYDRHSIREKRDKNEIGIHSIRGGTIVGEHDIIFSGQDEIITISHSARSKDIFALGAINAAIFLSNKDKGLYNMKDMIKDIN